MDMIIFSERKDTIRMQHLEWWKIISIRKAVCFLGVLLLLAVTGGIAAAATVTAAEMTVQPGNADSLHLFRLRHPDSDSARSAQSSSCSLR